MCFFFQAEDGIRYLVRSRGLGDVYKRQGFHPRNRDWLLQKGGSSQNVQSFVDDDLNALLEAIASEPDHDKRLAISVSYTHLRAHETVLDLVCRLLLEKQKKTTTHHYNHTQKINLTYI